MVAKLSASTVVKVWGGGASGSGVVLEIPKDYGKGTEKVIFTAYHFKKKPFLRQSLKVPGSRFERATIFKISLKTGILVLY